MNPQPKPKTYKNESYLNFIRGKGCLICGKKAEAHHVRRYHWGSGTSQKPHDYVAIPLCVEHHNPDTEDFLVCIECQIIDLLMEYVESKRKTRP